MSTEEREIELNFTMSGWCTKNNFYPYTEYICQCARNTVNNGHERRKHVKKKGQTC